MLLYVNAQYSHVTVHVISGDGSLMTAVMASRTVPLSGAARDAVRFIGFGASDAAGAASLVPGYHGVKVTSRPDSTFSMQRLVITSIAFTRKRGRTKKGIFSCSGMSATAYGAHTI